MDQGMWAFIHNEIGSSKHAVVPVGCQSSQYGLGVFEGIRCYNTTKGPAIFRLRDHMRRLVFSSLELEMEPSLSSEEMVRAVIETVKRNFATDPLFEQDKECYIRPCILYTGQRMGLTIDPKGNTFFVLVYRWDKYFGKEEGVNLGLSQFVRPHPASLKMSAKACGTYLNSFYAHHAAKTLGYDDALMLDHKGFVAEATTSNIFLVTDFEERKILTPNSKSILHGLTRDTVIHIAEDLGINISETETCLELVSAAKEMFLAGTAVEISPVSSIYNEGIAKLKKFGDGGIGPVTAEIKDSFKKIVHGEIPKYEKWLTYI